MILHDIDHIVDVVFNPFKQDFYTIQFYLLFLYSENMNNKLPFYIFCIDVLSIKH